jgi:hypothetical protein
VESNARLLEQLRGSLGPIVHDRVEKHPRSFVSVLHSSLMLVGPHLQDPAHRIGDLELGIPQDASLPQLSRHGWPQVELSFS